eukprot:CAMPEP_0196590662 /NCGR_PEP_ID=MMETSP1081-20130531/67187_1 /TAXON_ID=36882 /ORGANISM="Pyramimonas amylifera, Strain CCMP720" /LENGTH=155 /DNA_ID=CAMNT_0041913817 /DNA_START=374 /DNA_END=841 /DNA_ORIENTATION=-
MNVFVALCGGSIDPTAFLYCYTYDEQAMKVAKGAVMDSYASVCPHNIVADIGVGMGVVNLGAGSYMGPKSNLACGGKLPRGTRLSGFSRPMAAQTLLPGKEYAGSPAHLLMKQVYEKASINENTDHSALQNNVGAGLHDSTQNVRIDCNVFDSSA